MTDRSSIRFTWWLRPSWMTARPARGPRRRARAGAVRPSSSSTPARELRQRLVGRIALDLGDVDLVDLVARVREPVGELAVVGEQEHTGRVGVEPADRDDARRMVDEVDDRRPAARVARRRDDPGRLVQEHVGELLLRERLPVELDPVTRRDERVQLPGLAVDRDAAGLDQLVGTAPGGDAGAGEPGIQAHRASIFTA